MPRNSRRRVFVAICAMALLLTCASASAAVAALRAPTLASPAGGSVFDAVPSFGWKAVGKSAKYEFQLAADRHFESIVLGDGIGGFQTRNTFATIDQALPNGDYYWRVRSISSTENAGRWSRPRRVRKNWDVVPELVEPVQGEAIAYPTTPLVLRWKPVPRAFKYLLWIGTDPSLASVEKPIETSATVYSPPHALDPGRYYWAVTPVDAQSHLGTRSGVGSFEWTWPSRTDPKVFDLNADERVFDPQFSWDAVPGAARYEVEINPSADFAVGSKVCCDEKVIGTSLSPKDPLPNNTYYWRVRAVDLDDQAGVWNQGTPFLKTFDAVVPTIPNLRMRDNVTETPSDSDPTTVVLDTSYPLMRWDPVPGASSYQVEVAPFEGMVCNWTTLPSRQWEVTTATTAWAPMAYVWNGQSPSVTAGQVAYDGGVLIEANRSYCARVRARTDRDKKQNDVVSDWTQLGGINNPAFKWVPPPPGGETAGPGFTMPSIDGQTSHAYLEPVTGAVSPRMPFFTWKPINGAGSYFVVVAKDPSFTQVVDVALTNMPMYAPRKAFGSTTYPDETTSYYWAVVPAVGANGDGASSTPVSNYPRAFEKRSVPPALLTPANGADVLRQAVFRWTATEGAREYTLQVATDPSFSSLLDNVNTAATSYTSETTYPADTVLYWRVRANDENLTGLTWSEVRTFRRRLPIPQVSAGNPTAGETIPVLSWEPVEGATSYEVHVDQADGTKKDFPLRGTALTATGWYGTGIWHWQVRANFPSASLPETKGGYTAAQPFTRRIATPANLSTIASDRHVLFRWSPAAMAKNYRVDVSRTDSFSRLLESVNTDHTAWAPKLTQTDYVAGGKFYWRVAAIDEGRNVGGWRVASFKTKRGFILIPSGLPQKKVVSPVSIRVTDGTSRPIRKAKAVLTGAGIKRRAKRTRGDGTASFTVTPRKRGKLRFKVSKRGFRVGTVTLDVR